MWENFPLFPERASTLADQVDAVFAFTVGVTVVFSTLIAALVLYLGLRYRRRHADEIGEREHAAWWLEIAWSVIPLGILLVMFAWGAKVFFFAFRPPSNAAEYYVVGKQWMWKIQHPAGNREINELHVPKGQPIKLTLTSEDVIHSFYVPAFRTKMDAIPGRYTTSWFEATKTGEYYLFCAEYCGAEHSRMMGRIVVMEPNDYQEWLTTGGVTPAGLPTGEELFVQKTCSTCHHPDSAATAPILDGLYGSEVQLVDGSTVTADDAYLRESILDPQAKTVAGYAPVMPTFQGQVSEEEMIQLIQYIKSLGADRPAETPAEQPAGTPAASGEGEAAATDLKRPTSVSAERRPTETPAGSREGAETGGSGS